MTVPSTSKVLRFGRMKLPHGFLDETVHRFVGPPPDQAELPLAAGRGAKVHTLRPVMSIGRLQLGEGQDLAALIAAERAAAETLDGFRLGNSSEWHHKDGPLVCLDYQHNVAERSLRQVTLFFTPDAIGRVIFIALTCNAAHYSHAEELLRQILADFEVFRVVPV